MIDALALAALVLAAMPASLLAVNLVVFRRPQVERSAVAPPRVSLLVPARDEELSIGACVEAALASRGVDLEVVVMDDHSTDRTAAIVSELAERDRRVRLESAPPLPSGWNGKQHACWALSRVARHDVLAFIDADVRLEPDGLAGCASFLEQSGADLVSGIPRQETGTLSEKLVVPLIDFLLLCYLPIPGMRQSPQPSFSAGCGQLFVTTREAYETSGGHRAIRSSRHDGIMLPRAYRKAGLMTDLFDATATARCRIYRSGAELWRGFTKNADEGMASPQAILPWTVLLFGGHVLPFVLLASSIRAGASATVVPFAAAGCILSIAARGAVTLRFRQSPLGWLLHPVGVLVVLAIQWDALSGKAVGRRTAWKGRA